MLGQLSKGMVLSAMFVLLICGFWPLRLPRYYAGFAGLGLSWILLGVCSACSAQLIRSPKSGDRLSKWWFAFTLPVAFLIVSLTARGIVRASGFAAFDSPSTSMEPMIQKGDRIVVDIRAYHASLPQYQDVIVFRRTDDFAVKRIIAMGGNTIEGRAGQILLSGNLINESYVEHSKAQRQSEPSDDDWMQSFGPITIPPNKYFVMGDNRDISLDSRSTDFGLVDRAAILGRVLYVSNAARQGGRIR
jgi:signal peptidase I